jgi:uncharacterized membrane protein
VRASDGTITTFDVPGDTDGTEALSINNKGAVAGNWFSAGSHCFVRHFDGKITSFDVSGSTRTVVERINYAGSVAGYYADNHFRYHGFVRAADGTITSFDAPGAATKQGRGTFAYSINDTGAITGNYSDNADHGGMIHGFVRAADGTITTFDAPGVGTQLGSSGTMAFDINDAGLIVGAYEDSNLGRHGFVRTADGVITAFDGPRAGTRRDEGTVATSVNTKGWIAGYYTDGRMINHGFVRSANGKIARFDPPGTLGLGLGINSKGVIAGYAYESSDTGPHGFVRTP